MSLKIKPSGKQQSAKPSSTLLASTQQDQCGVAGMGMNQRAGGLAYPMVLLLKKFLITLKRGEQVLEAQRQILAALPEFEPHAAFQRINRSDNRTITSVDILKFLRHNGVEEANESDCHAIIKYFDGQGGDSLHFNDFLQILMPCDQPNLRADIAQRPNFLVPNAEYLGPRVEAELACLFEKEIAFNRVMEEQKQTIECSKQFDYDRAFAEIDDWSYGFIDKKNLKSFLRKHGCTASNKDATTIIRRMDLDGDARLSKEEFVHALIPEEPYSKLLKRQKEKERSKSRFNEKVGKQGESKVHYQDVVLNLHHGQRNNLRTLAQDRAMSASGFKGSRSLNNYGNLGSSALKIRPDVHRISNGFFMKDPASHNVSKRRQQEVASSALILPKKYSEQHKENFYRKLQKGEISEEFKQKNVWRPGGNAIKVKTQLQADVTLIQTSKTLTRSTSQQKQQKQKKLKRIKSAGGNRNTLKMRKGKASDYVQQARTAIQGARRLELEGGGEQDRFRRRNFNAQDPPSIFDHSRQGNNDLDVIGKLNKHEEAASSEYKRANPRPYGASARFGPSRYSPDMRQESSATPKMLSSNSLRQSHHRGDRSGSNSGPEPQLRDKSQSSRKSRQSRPSSHQKTQFQHGDNAAYRSRPKKNQWQEDYETFKPIQPRDQSPGQAMIDEKGRGPNVHVPYFRNADDQLNQESMGRYNDVDADDDWRQRGRRSDQEEDLSAHIQRSSKVLRTKLQPREQVLSESPSRSPNDRRRAYANDDIEDYHNKYAAYNMSPLRSAEKQHFRRDDPQPVGEDSRMLLQMNGIDNRLNERPPSESSGAVTRAPKAQQLQKPPGARNEASLNSSETATLVECFIELVDLTRTLESTRMDLACMTDFNLMDAFSIFDDKGRGHCTQEEFKAKLAGLGLDPIPGVQQVQAFFRRYNKSDDGLLKYSEFMHAVCPRSEIYADMLRQRKVNNVYNKPKLAITMFQSDTYANFLRVLEAIIATEMGTEAIRQKLKQRKDFSPQAAFLTLASSQLPGHLQAAEATPSSPGMPAHVTSRNIRDLMERYGHLENLEDLDIGLLVDRFDKDGDGMIGLSEFCELLEPFG